MVQRGLLTVHRRPGSPVVEFLLWVYLTISHTCKGTTSIIMRTYSTQSSVCCESVLDREDLYYYLYILLIIANFCSHEH